MSGVVEQAGTVKLASWKPTGPPPKQESLDHIKLITGFVKAKYKKRRQPIGLLQIYLEYKSVVLDETGQVRKSWPWAVHGKRWLDRRVNEAADPRFYENCVPEIVAATSGCYVPNPALYGRVHVYPGETPP